MALGEGHPTTIQDVVHNSCHTGITMHQVSFSIEWVMCLSWLAVGRTAFLLGDLFGYDS